MVLVVVEAVELAKCLQSRRCVSSLIKAMHDEGELATSQEAFLMKPPSLSLTRLAANRREALGAKFIIRQHRVASLSSRLSLTHNKSSVRDARLALLYLINTATANRQIRSRAAAACFRCAAALISYLRSRTDK
jgi:hypothetical protein